MATQQDPPSRACDAYDLIAERYAEHSEASAHNAYCERPATLSLLPDVRGMRVLDAGCGPGFYSEWLLKHGAEVVAVDGSARMLELTRQRVGSSVAMRQWDLLEPLEFLPDAALDLVLCALVLDHFADLTPIFTEFHRVLRPSGLLVFSMDHPTWGFLQSGRRYFDTELLRDDSGFGVVIPCYRRPLGAILQPLRAAGLLMEDLVEARPVDECERRDPAMHAELSRRPSFLCIRAQKEAIEAV
jgi:ubiquinone/menaquinone biosynthesis C-methylase UbiE